MPLASTFHQISLKHTLLVAAALHAFVITSVGFKTGPRQNVTPASLEVVILQTQDDTPPEQADYLAQVSADGGDRSPDPDRPGAPFVSEEPVAGDGVAPQPMVASAPPVPTERAEELLVALYSSIELYSDHIANTDTTPQEYIAEQQVVETQSLAQIATEVRERLANYAKRPRKQFVTARTKASPAARYMHDWVSRVERIGNLNYPDQVARDRLSGVLVLSVGIYRDGSVANIEVKKSSGHRILDDAAQRIVQLAAPYAPLNKELAESTDVLYITRSWAFSGDNTLIAKAS